MIDLSGKVALVTGASRGIGQAIALTLNRAGAIVYITYKDNVDAACEMATLGIRAKGGAILPPLRLDVLSKSSIEHIRDEIEKDGYKLDILVNNAGINRPNDFDQISYTEWAEVIDTNLTGPFLVTQTLLPIMNDGGSIINIGSVSGHIGGPRSTHYAASKAGLVALSSNIALFAAKRNIRCNVVSAGYVASPMASKGMLNKNVHEKVNQISLGRLATQQEIADSVLFLSSNLASYITGHVLHVNGGLYMG